MPNDIASSLQRLIDAKSDIETGISSFCYSVVSDVGLESLANYVSDISTDINNELILALGGTFYATINVTAPTGSIVTATLSSNTISKIAVNNLATFVVDTSGTYTITGTYNGTNLTSTTVIVTSTRNDTYSATIQQS
jgi:hypothetical protein